MSAASTYKLQDAGFSGEQIEALSSFIGGEHASKSDLLESKVELKHDISHVDLKVDRVDGKLDRLDVTVNARFDKVYWMLSVGLALLIALFVKLVAFP